MQRGSRFDLGDSRGDQTLLLLGIAISLRETGAERKSFGRSFNLDQDPLESSAIEEAAQTVGFGDGDSLSFTVRPQWRTGRHLRPRAPCRPRSPRGPEQAVSAAHRTLVQ